MAVAAPIAPVSVPTGLGAREMVDLGQPVLNFQRLENPQTSLYQCGTKYGAQLVRSIFQKLEERAATDAHPDVKFTTLATFTELNLSDNKIGDDGAKWLQQGLSGNTNLKRLYVPRCDIKAEGFKYMGKLIGACPSLEELVLSSNKCDNGLNGEFSEGLAMNKTLKSLYLGVCRLGNEGIRPLCQGPLKIHPALEHLSLTYNRLEAPSVKYLNEALSSNKALKYLDLSGNSLGPDGAEALVTGLKANKGNLEKLSLAQNEMKLSGCRALTQFFLSKDGQNMVYCDLRHNLVTYRGMVELRNEMGRPLPGDVEKEDEEGWLILFGKRQIFVNAH